MLQKRMKTGEVAKLLGLNIRTLQRYDKPGLLPARRTPTNRRYYLESDVTEFIAKWNSEKAAELTEKELPL